MVAVFDQRYVKRLSGPNVKKGANKHELAEQVVADIREFKRTNQLDRLVLVWCGSTEVFMEAAPVHQSLAAFEQGLERSDPAIPSSMIYAYAAIKEGCRTPRRSEPQCRHPRSDRAGSQDGRPTRREGP